MHCPQTATSEKSFLHSAVTSPHIHHEESKERAVVQHHIHLAQSASAMETLTFLLSMVGKGEGHHFNLTYYFASFLFSLNQTLNSNSGCWMTASELPHCTRSGMPHVSISAALDAQLPGSMGGSTTPAHRMVRTKCLLLNWHIHSRRSVWFFFKVAHFLNVLYFFSSKTPS